MAHEVEENIDQAALDNVMEAQYGPRTQQYGLHLRHLQKYNHMLAIACHIVAIQATE